jgi:geranylgeranyl pyrophosphate synthase
LTHSTDALLSPAPATAPAEKPRKRKTSHLKIVPEPRTLREQLKKRCFEVATRLDKSRPLSKDEMESVARQILAEENLPEGHVGWTMVVLATEFWREQVKSIPHNRRLLLLPHCLKHAEGCPADYDEFGLDCRKCGACTIADFRTTAENLGYKVLVAEGSPIVLKIIVSGYVDAIVGVACLNVLEKAIDKILLAGIPCMAVPLLSSDCRNTGVDEDWVADMIGLPHVVEPAAEQTKSYVHLMRAAARMFEREELERLVPRQRGGPSLAEMNGQGIAGIDPIAGTEAIAYDFLSKGGKHSRPFITLAVYDALTGGLSTRADGAEHLATLSESVKRVAMSIETFHKASLVHDDIEDDDSYRYGDQTLHRKYGTATAINVGDFLIGMGYRLVSREAKTLGPEVVSEIIDRLADAHLKLSEGQGAELLWRDSHTKQLTPLDALKIYALKTAPAFEAALFSGLRLAGPIDQYLEPVAQFARHLGVAFQILNDLADWRGDDHNKLISAGDVLGGRPTVLWALALEGLDEERRTELKAIVATQPLTDAVVRRVRQLYQEAGVYDKAARLVEKYRQRAEAVADGIEPEELRQLLYYLIDTVLADEGQGVPQEPQIIVESISAPLPIVANG